MACPSLSCTLEMARLWLKDQWWALSASCQSKRWSFPIRLRPCLSSDHLAMRGLLRRKSLNNPKHPTFSSNAIFNYNSNLLFFDIAKSLHLVLLPAYFTFDIVLFFSLKDLTRFSVQIFKVTQVWVYNLYVGSHNRCLKDVLYVTWTPSHTIKHII